MSELLAFIRGMAMFGKHRVSKGEQEELLRRYLPEDIEFRGAFDKSGNYALISERHLVEIGEAVLGALWNDERLLDLSQVKTIPVDSASRTLKRLVEDLMRNYGEKFNVGNFGLEIDGAIWRAGLCFMSKPVKITPFCWPHGSGAKVSVLWADGPIVGFLKREERGDENRISFGDPTQAVDRALIEHLGREVTSTSRSGRTVRGVLALFKRRSM